MARKLSYASALTGRRAEAQRVLDQLNQLIKQKYVPPEAAAFIYVGFGEKRKAFECLEKGYVARSIGLGVVDLKVNRQSVQNPKIRSEVPFAGGS